jgi:Kef-type K+ transport system membrane component KefB
MNKTELSRFFRPVIIFFILINALCLSCANWLDKKNIDHIVLMYANAILFLLTLIACYIHIRAIKNNNPYAFVRGVTLASLMKLLVIVISVAIYFFSAETKSVYAVITAMILYIVYTVFEVKGAMRINRNRNAKN